MASVLDRGALQIAVKRYSDSFTSKLKPFFPDDPLLELGSDNISWDLEEYSDVIDDVYTTAGGDPIEMSREAVKMGVARMPGLSYRVWLTEQDLLWEKALGMTGAEMAASMVGAKAQKVNREIAAKVRRIERQKEHERAMALAGTLAYNIGAAAVSVDMGLETSPDQTPTAAVTWATASTDIIADLLTWSSLLEQLCGEPAKYAIMNSVTFGYLAKNTALSVWAQATASGSALQVDGAGMVIPICGLTCILLNRTYTKSGSATKYVPDDKVVLLPDPAVLTPGSEITGPAIGTGGAIEWGLTTKVVDWPDGKTSVDVKKASLNILTRPRAVIYGDATT